MGAPGRARSEGKGEPKDSTRHLEEIKGQIKGEGKGGSSRSVRERVDVSRGEGGERPTGFTKEISNFVNGTTESEITGSDLVRVNAKKFNIKAHRDLILSRVKADSKPPAPTRKKTSPRKTSSDRGKYLAGLGLPMTFFMIFALWRNSFSRKKEPKQLTETSEESSTEALVVRKKESEALAVRNREIKAIDGSERNLFEEKTMRERGIGYLKWAKDVILTPFRIYIGHFAVYFEILYRMSKWDDKGFFSRRQKDLIEKARNRLWQFSGLGAYLD